MRQVAAADVRGVMLPILHCACASQHFSDLGQAKGSKLVRRLLKLGQVTGVFLGRDFISVNKREDASWMVRKRA